MTLHELLLDILDILEKQESSLLTWGDTEGSFAEDELISIISKRIEILNSAGQQIPEEVLDEWEQGTFIIDELIDHCLIFRLPNSNSYRSRMAESVRLLSKNRQLFSNNWEEAPDLVGDYRFLKKPRLYPKRDISVTTLLAELPNINNLSKEVIEAIVGTYKLGQFQVDATKRISETIGKNDSFGTIVCAGTGSGKTLSFYLPTISTIAESVSGDSSSWTRTIAIYPRNELLKDQLSETVSILQKVNPVLNARGIRPITVGAYFGPAPHSNMTQLGWAPISDGNICPFVICPECESRMKWRTEDREQNREILICDNDENHSVDCIHLTRCAIKDSPPDILFTSTEMLNQRMADSSNNKIFGIGTADKRKPLMFLLDEVHTYYGTHGAQVASLIKRWRHLSNAKPHFVGLSATLQDAKRFFSTLTGLGEGAVTQVSPLMRDMEEEGSEYMIVLRGNPVSKKSLMSTTIQTALLMNRMSDHPDYRKSNGVYGTKQFVFGDDLDVINRLYYNILDAEGRDSFERINVSQAPLASFRDSAENQKFEEGQSWKMGEDIGHNLLSPPIICRVSSQDSGFNSEATTIVASSSLEVGFNDPDVGTVIQHKAPRDNASFLQRKGRAGRKRTMRPWTIVVLSDYGRDRLAYQNYDHLFDPEVSARNLPVKNLYVLRMQAVYTTMDWLCRRLGKGNIWSDLSGNINNKPKNGEALSRLEAIKCKIESVLKGEYDYDDLYRHVKRALRLWYDDADLVLHAIFWEHPRGLMVSVLPALLRKIETHWTRNDSMWTDRYEFWHPLPDFVASTLFGDLNLAEVDVRIPAQTIRLDDEVKSMPIRQAMKEFAPGRVSKRFATINTYASVWIDPYKNNDHSIDIQDYCGMAYIQYPEEFIYFDGSNEKSVPCIKPNVILTNRPGKDIGDTSNAFVNWKSQVVGKGSGVVCELPKESNWSEIIDNLTFFVHNNHSSIEVRRFTLGTTASISFRNRHKDSETFECNFVKAVDNMFDEETTEPVAVGYSQDVDGFSINFKIPENIFCGASDKQRSLRVNYFSYLFNKQSNLNIFLSDRILRVYLISLIYTSYIKEINIENAFAELKQKSLDDNLTLIQKVIDTTIGLSLSGNSTDLVEDLRSTFSDSVIWDLLFKLSPVLYNEKAFDDDNWLIKVYKSTLGAAVHLALQKICPDLDLDEVLVDTELSKRELESGRYTVWFTEQGPGGLGVIEQVLDKYNRDPRKLLDMIEDCLSETNTEQVDMQLYRILEKVNNNVDMRKTVDSIRSSNSFEKRVAALTELQVHITDMGFDAENHCLMSCISNRLLKSGTSPDTDSCLYIIVDEWRKLEERIGIDVDIEAFAFCAVETDEIDLKFCAANNKPQTLFNSVYSMLWARGGKVRSESLNVYNPFSPMPPTERLLVRDSLTKSIRELALTNTEQFYIDLERVLEEDGIIKVKSKTSKTEELTKMIQRLIINGLDIFSLILFPRIVGIRKHNKYTYTTIDIREKIQ